MEKTDARSLDEIFGQWPCWPYGLTVVSGASGSGKTSFCAWAAREHALVGGKSLIISLDQQPIGVVAKLMRQQIGGDIFTASDAERNAAVDALEAMGVRVVDRCGRAKVDDIIENVRDHQRQHGTDFVLVDHLSYLIESNEEIDHVVQTLAMSGAQDRIAYVLIAPPKIPPDWSVASLDWSVTSLGLRVELLREPGPARTRIHSDDGGRGYRTLFYGGVSGRFAERYEDLPSADRGTVEIGKEDV